MPPARAPAGSPRCPVYTAKTADVSLPPSARVTASGRTAALGTSRAVTRQLMESRGEVPFSQEGNHVHRRRTAWRIRRALARRHSRVACRGRQSNRRIDGTRPIDSLIGMYLRSPRFAECLQILLDAGARSTTGLRFYRREAGGLARIRSPRASTNIRTAA